MAEPASEPGWAPRLVALDIDGTLLSWVDGGGTTYETVTPRVREAVRRALDAGAHVVLASGRSAHSMTGVADLLGLRAPAGDTGPDGTDEPLWIVAGNGAVLSRYRVGGVLEVVHEETFEAGPAVRAVLAAHPTALVAVEDRGRGYLVSAPFPEGELTGDIAVTDLEAMVAHPVSRVVIRDPASTVEEFVTLAADLGLHGTDYVVGWTAWLDLTPVGVSKASGLEHVCERLGLAAADVLAIGDGRNDIEMLRWAGRGVAMGQAVELVRGAADAVTAPVAEDGVAVELERWF